VEALLGRYVSRDLVAEILRRGRMPGLGGETIEEAVVLFTDISGYVALADRLKKDPQTLVSLLNEHFTGLTEAVLEHGGWVNNFMGDALLALFGVPVPHPKRDALNAVKAALAMRESVLWYNQVRLKRGQLPLRIGVGLHVGPMVAGHIGAPQRMNYTVIGDAVNVAARLESLTREWFREQPGEDVPFVAILLSGELYAHVADAVEANLWREAAHVKNRPEPVTVYELVGMKAG
jgi:adenylate cyclase